MFSSRYYTIYKYISKKGNTALIKTTLMKKTTAQPLTNHPWPPYEDANMGVKGPGGITIL